MGNQQYDQKRPKKVKPTQGLPLKLPLAPNNVPHTPSASVATGGDSSPVSARVIPYNAGNDTEVPQLLTCLISDLSQGYLKFCPSNQMGKCFIYFKWTGGKFAGHYVVVVYSILEVVEGLRKLVEKVEECESGRRKPTPDHFPK